MSTRSFRCDVRSATGAESQQLRCAADERSLLEALHAEGLFPVRIEELSASVPAAVSAEPVRGGQPSAETFFRIAYFFAKARLPMTAAAEAYARAHPGSSGDALAAALSAGRPLSSAVAQALDDIPAFALSLLAAGERAGDLAPALAHVGAYYDQQRSLRDRLTAAAAYPAVLGVTGIASVYAVLLFVVPRIRVSLGRVDLPWLTKVLLQCSDALREPVWLVASFALLCGVGVGVYRARGMFARCLPWYGRFAADRDAYALCAGLRMLVASKVPVAEAFGALAAAFPARGDLAAITERLRAGVSLPEVLRGGTVFGPMADVVIAGGYESGSFAESLASAEEEARGRMERSMQIMHALLEPAVLLAVGGVLGTLIIGIMLPLMDVSQRGM